MKPLFIPLRTRWFNAFRSGEKRVEWRPYGPRWNATTLIEGRPVILSEGYSGPRIEATIASWRAVPASEAPPEAREIYPDVREFAAISLAI
jgi:hypothetical protein